MARRTAVEQRKVWSMPVRTAARPRMVLLMAHIAGYAMQAHIVAGPLGSSRMLAATRRMMRGPGGRRPWRHEERWARCIRCSRSRCTQRRSSVSGAAWCWCLHMPPGCMPAECSWSAPWGTSGSPASNTLSPGRDGTGAKSTASEQRPGGCTSSATGAAAEPEPGTGVDSPLRPDSEGCSSPGSGPAGCLSPGWL